MQSAALSAGLYDSFGNVKKKVDFICIVGTALVTTGMITSGGLVMVVKAYGFDDVIATLTNSRLHLFTALKTICAFFGFVFAIQLARERTQG